MKNKIINVRIIRIRFLLIASVAVMMTACIFRTHLGADFAQGITYYVNYISWMTLALIGVLTFKIQRKWLFLAAILVVNDFIGKILGYTFFDNGLFAHIHRNFIYVTCMATVCGIDWSPAINRRDIDFFMNFMFAMGIFSAVYAMTAQYQIMLGVLTGKLIDGWEYVGFFFHRNLFASFFHIFVIVAVYLYEISRKNEGGGQKNPMDISCWCFTIFLANFYHGLQKRIFLHNNLYRSVYSL